MKQALSVLVALFLGLCMLAGAPAALGQDEVVVSVKPQKAAVMPGETLAVAVIFDHEEGWHIHTAEPVPPPGVEAEALIATVVEPRAHEQVRFWGVQWPEGKPELVDLGLGPTEYKVYGGRAIAYVPIEVSPDAEPGSEIELFFRIEYQACDETQCLIPEELVERATLRVISLEEAAAMATASPDADFAGFDPEAFAFEPGAAEGRGAGGIDLGAFNLRLNVDPSGLLGLVVLMLVGFVGGFLLNLTPCVLPVIPIKIMGLSQAAGNPSRCFLLGLAMSIGVLTFWLAIGVAIAVLAVLGSAAELFGLWWFTLALGLFIGVMGIGMMGLFTMQLPQAVYRVNPRHDTLAGSFLFGIMTAVLGLPCFAPFMGGATGVALAVSPGVGLAAFGAIGAGMAFPYLVLSARPKWIEVIPRTGPASELIKQVMGLLLLAAAAFFVGSGLVALVMEWPYFGRVLHWWVVALFAVMAGGWLALRTFQITRSRAKRVVFGGIGGTVAALGLSIAMAFTAIHRDAGLWIRYTPEAFERAQAAGQVVVIDFTAEWCLNCHALKLTVLSRGPVKRALSSGGVVAMTADLTRVDDPGWEKLQELGERGIPLLAVFGPGYEQPFKSNAYTVDQVVVAIEQAKRPRRAAVREDQSGEAAPAGPKASR